MSDDVTVPSGPTPEEMAAQAAARAEAEAAVRAAAEAAAAEQAAQDRARAEAAAAAVAAAQAAAAAGLAEREKAEADALAASLAAIAEANADAKPIDLPPTDIVTAPRGSFGPTFRAELIAAGVAALAFMDYPDRVIFSGSIDPEDRARVMAVIAAHDPSVVPVAVPPDCPSLAFWLTALDLWLRDDGQGGKVARTVDVQASIAGLVAAGNPLGKLAARRLEYANTVLRADLLRLAPAFAFSAADCDESLWRADRVAKGDLTGVWPLPA